jgi:peptide/nickel transport system ATP-binding protein
MSSTLALELECLTICDDQGRLVVHNVSASLAAGEVLLIVGGSGSGKSLIARALMGLLPRNFSARGRIRYGDGPWLPTDQESAIRAQWARTVTLLPQEPNQALDPSMRVGKQLSGIPGVQPEGITKTLSELDLPEDVTQFYPAYLSGGMAQRVMVAGAVLAQAGVVIVDEPTKGLDASRIGQAASALRAMARRGQALVIITHDIALARAIGHRCIVLQEGEVVERGSVAEILNAPSHSFTRKLLAADPDLWPARRPHDASQAAVLEARGLTFGFARKSPVVSDLSLCVRSGEALAVVGPSGCGKTTLGNVLLGLHRPQHGRVGWGDVDPYRDRAGGRRLRQAYQKLHQDPGRVFAPHRTVGDHVTALKALMPPVDIEARLPHLMDRLHLRNDLLLRHRHEISGGEAQRLALVRILLLNPRFIVADEPTSRLDLIAQQFTLRLLRELADAEGIGVLLITHHDRIARSFGNQVLDLARP